MSREEAGEVREVEIEDRFRKPAVARDIKVLGGLAEIWCRGHHRAAERRPVATPAAKAGVYGARRPVLCAECEAHLVYAEKRRALCPKDPKPFCSYCDTHCYKRDEREWLRRMMRYAGPRSLFSRHAVHAVRHLIAGAAHRKGARN
ncbi:MAG: nitrous oxide-stimulated promoter family protein [Coriobacteriia bacterium]